jgi:hypothetical protein
VHDREATNHSAVSEGKEVERKRRIFANQTDGLLLYLIQLVQWGFRNIPPEWTHILKARANECLVNRGTSGWVEETS